MALINGSTTLIDPNTGPLVTPDPGPLVTPGSAPLVTPDPAPLITPAPVTRDWIAPTTAPDLNAWVPGNWSPTGAPQPGDTLTMHSGIMDIAGFALNGDTLTVGINNSVASQQINLTDQGRMSVNTASGSTDTLNIFASGGNHDVNLHADGATINIQIGLLAEKTGDLTADTFDLTNSSLNVIGGTGFLNTGSINLQGSHAFIHSDLEGTGSIKLTAPVHGSTMEFGSSVSSSQSIEVDGNVANKAASSVRIDDPASFGGSVNLQYGFVDLRLATIADSYSYANDMMTIWRGTTALDTLALKSPSSFQGSPLTLSVMQTASGVVIDNSNAIFPGSIQLPQHIA